MTLEEATYLCYLRAMNTLWHFYLGAMALAIQLRSLGLEF